MKTNCTDCTADNWCVWVSSSSSVGLAAVRKSDKKNIVSVQDVNFCWSGTFYGATNLVYDNVQDLTSSDTTITATIGFNDFNWKQCTVKGGVVLILSIAAPVLSCLFLCALCICICCCCCRKTEESYPAYQPINSRY
jgi:hypothetical protein